MPARCEVWCESESGGAARRLRPRTADVGGRVFLLSCALDRASAERTGVARKSRRLPVFHPCCTSKDDLGRALAGLSKRASSLSTPPLAKLPLNAASVSTEHLLSATCHLSEPVRAAYASTGSAARNCTRFVAPTYAARAVGERNSRPVATHFRRVGVRAAAARPGGRTGDAWVRGVVGGWGIHVHAPRPDDATA